MNPPAPPGMQEVWGLVAARTGGTTFPEQAGDAPAEQLRAAVPRQAGRRHGLWLERCGSTLGGYARCFPERG